MSISNILSLTILLLLFFTGVTMAAKNTWIPDHFSYTNTKAIQGILSIIILFHYMYQVIRDNSKQEHFLTLYSNVGILCVAFFFFCSGYGLMHSLSTKKNYLHGFLKRRIFTVLVPFFLCNYLYILIALLSGKKFSNADLFAAFFGLRLLNTQLWFGIEIMILYMIFYLTFRYLKNENFRLVLIAFAILIMIGIGITRIHQFVVPDIKYWFHGEWWYNTTLFFLVGMLIGKYRKHFYSFCQKYYCVLLGSTGALVILFSCKYQFILNTWGYWTDYFPIPMNQILTDRLITLLYEEVFIATTLLFFYLLMMKIRFYNRALQYLGKISLEIILLSNVSVTLLDFLMPNLPALLYTTVSIFLTIIMASLFHFVKQNIIQR